ncbi:hypothetical protein ACFLUU_09220 [Chloroflexota bacterium]
MNWFRQHINWTFFLAWLVGIALYLSTIPIMVNSEGPEIFILFYSLFIIWLLLVGGWFLKQKGRSLWYLLMLPFLREIGVIIFLLLEDRTTPEGSRVFRLSDIYKSSDSDELIHTDYDFRYLQEVLSCPTCVYDDQEARNQGNPWCSALQPPDIIKNRCNSWQAVNNPGQ